jgi:hypothetical protein
MIAKQAGDKGILPGTVVDTIYKFRDGAWTLVPTKLMKPRYDFKTVLNGENIFIFCGDSGDGKPATTQIEIFNVKNFSIQIAEYRMPLGVSAPSMAWHGDDILLIGGNRCGTDDGSCEVVKIDFKEKNILSLRDLHTKRSNAIVIPIEHDRIAAIAGAKSKASSEERFWCPDQLDYVWADCTSKIKGDTKEIMEKPSEYSAVLRTFCVSGSDLDLFPELDPNSNFVFGNELSPFMMEFTREMKVNFYPAPMRLQQKTGQLAYRFSHDIMYFVGGTDTTYTFYSKKVFKFDIRKREVTQSGNLIESRTMFCLVPFEVSDRLESVLNDF